MNPIQVLAGPIGEAQAELFFESLNHATTQGRKILIIVPNRQVKDAVRRRLIKDYSDGLIGRTVQTLHEFIHLQSGVPFGSQVRELLWWILTVREIPEASPLGQVKHFPSICDALSQTVLELAQGGVLPDEFQKVTLNSSTLLNQFSEIYKKAFSAGVIPLQAALQKTIDQLTPNKFDQTEIFVTGFLYFHPSQLHLIRAIQQCCHRLTLTLPYEEVRPNIFGLTEENLSFLPDHQRLDIQRTRFIEEMPINLFEAPSIEEEVAGILTHIKQQILKSYSPERVVIALRDYHRYQPLISRLAEEFGIPISTPQTPLYSSNTFLQLAIEDFPTHAPIEEYLSLTERCIEELKSQNNILWRELRSTIEELSVHLEAFRTTHISRGEWEALLVAQREERKKGSHAQTEGLRVLDLQQPFWGGFDLVAIPGLGENWFPKPPPIPSLLDSTTKKTLNERLKIPRLWTSLEYRIREELLFTVVCDRASTEILLSRPLADENGGECNRSLFLEELLAIHPNIQFLTPETGLSSPRRLAGMYMANENNLLPEGARNYLLSHHSDWISDLLRKRKVEKVRRFDEPSSIQDQGLLTELQQRFSNAGNHIAVTSLERYGKCPFRFFAHDILSLPEPEEDGVGISSLRSGILLHDLLHHVYKRWMSQSEEPISFENLETALLLMKEVSEERFKHRRNETLGMSLPIWESECHMLRQTLHRVLQREAEYSLKTRRRPWKLEHRFEGTFPLGATESISLRGQIDRIDVEEENLFVIDYKRGRQVPTPSGIDQGINLQLPVYLHVAKELFARPLAGGAYYALGEERLRGTLPSRGKSIDDEVSRAMEWALKYLGAIAQGNFSAQPKECHGRRCAFHRLCRERALPQRL